MRLEWVVPPPVGAFAERPGAWWHRGWGLGWWARQRSRAQRSPVAVGDGQGVGGTGDGDDAAVVQPVMVGADHRLSHESMVRIGRSACCVT